MARLLMKLFRLVIFLSLLFSLVHYFLSSKGYTFQHRELHKIAEKYAGQPPSQFMPKILLDIRRRYGPHVIAEKETDWVSMAAGGLRAKLFLISASLTEYLAVFGSPIRTSGHTGFHWVNQSCSVLLGSVERSMEGQLTKEDFGPGDYIRGPMLQTSHVALSDDTWLLCYGRGFLPVSLPFWTLENLFISTDIPSVGRLLFFAFRSTTREAGLWVQEKFEFYTSKRG